MNPHRSLLLAALASVFALASAAEPSLAIDLTVGEGSGDNPMIVAWVEREDGTFVRTLQMFSKDHKYYKDMTVWAEAREGRAEPQELDAVVGPTIVWGQHRRLTVPAADLLGKGLVLRIEQCKDKGGHYKKFKAPLTADWAGIENDKQGYIERLSIQIER